MRVCAVGTGPGAEGGHARPVLTLQSAAAAGEQQEQQEGQQWRRRRGGSRAGRGHGGGRCGRPRRAVPSSAPRAAPLAAAPRSRSGAAAAAAAAEPRGAGPTRQSARPWQPGAPGDGESGTHWAAVGRGRRLRGKMNWRGRALPGAPPVAPPPGTGGAGRGARPTQRPPAELGS